MLNFFKRSAAPINKAAAKPASGTVPAEVGKAAGADDPVASPEVLEGNEDSDWALWEDSVAFQDSQMLPLTSPASLSPAQKADPATGVPFTDAFSSVSKKDP